MPVPIYSPPLSRVNGIPTTRPVVSECRVLFLLLGHSVVQKRCHSSGASFDNDRNSVFYVSGSYDGTTTQIGSFTFHK